MEHARRGRHVGRGPADQGLVADLSSGRWSLMTDTMHWEGIEGCRQRQRDILGASTDENTMLQDPALDIAGITADALISMDLFFLRVLLLVPSALSRGQTDAVGGTTVVAAIGAPVFIWQPHPTLVLICHELSPPQSSAKGPNLCRSMIRNSSSLGSSKPRTGVVQQNGEASTGHGPRSYITNELK